MATYIVWNEDEGYAKQYVPASDHASAVEQYCDKWVDTTELNWRDGSAELELNAVNIEDGEDSPPKVFTAYASPSVWYRAVAKE